MRFGQERKQEVLQLLVGSKSHFGISGLRNPRMKIPEFVKIPEFSKIAKNVFFGVLGPQIVVYFVLRQI